MDSIAVRTAKTKQTNKNRIKWEPMKVLFPFFPLARYLGLFPCNGKWSLTVGWMKYSKCIILIPILMDIHQIIYGITMPDEVMSIAVFNIVLHEVRASCELISLFGYMYKIIKNKQELKTVTDHLKSRIPRESESFFAARYHAGFVICNNLFGLLILNWKTVWSKTIVRRIMITGVGTTNMYITFITVMYCSIIEVFKSDFKLVNSSVSEGADLKEAIKRHQFLNDLCNNTGKLFSVHLIGHCMKIAVTIVQDVHLVIQLALQPQIGVTITFEFASALQASCEFLYLHLITTYSEEVRVESQRFYQALSKRVLRHQKYYNDREITTYLTLRRTVKLTAAGFFELNRPVFTSVLGGCITYIVIVIQLSQTGG